MGVPARKACPLGVTLGDVGRDRVVTRRDQFDSTEMTECHPQVVEQKGFHGDR